MANTPRATGEYHLYGVPADLDLSGFYGATLIQIGVGENTLHFVFQPPVPRPIHTIMVEGGWVVRDDEGVPIDQVQEHSTRDAYRVHRLLSRDVVGSSLDAPRSFTLKFDSGHELEIIDDSTQYESFSIQPGDIYV